MVLIALWAAGLVAVCAYAAVLHLLAGQFRGDLLVYAAGAALVGVHGPATRCKGEEGAGRG